MSQGGADVVVLLGVLRIFDKHRQKSHNAVPCTVFATVTLQERILSMHQQDDMFI